MALYVRPLTDEERKKIERSPMPRRYRCGLARRARLIPWRRPASARRRSPAVQQSEKCVRRWIERFNADGVDGLDDAPRAGRPRTYPEDAYSRVIAKARDLPPNRRRGKCHRPAIGPWIDSKRSWPRRECRSSAARADACSRPSISNGRSRGPGWRARIRTSPKKGGHRRALHRAAGRQHGDLPRRTGPIAARRSPGPSWSAEALSSAFPS